MFALAWRYWRDSPEYRTLRLIIVTLHRQCDHLERPGLRGSRSRRRARRVELDLQVAMFAASAGSPVERCHTEQTTIAIPVADRQRC